MEDWSKELWEAFDTMSQEVEQFIQEVSDLAEAIAMEVQEAIESELDQWFDSCVTPFLFPLESTPQWMESVEDDLEIAFSEHLEPTSLKHPACVGCQHYHGQVYQGNLLVCAMHPYGSESSFCPDWEGATSERNVSE